VLWGVTGVDVVGTPGEVAAILATIDAPRADIAQLEAARIAAGRPRFGADVVASTLVNETPLLSHGVSLTKGCYPGQESVARVHNLGRVRRMLRGLRSEGSLVVGAEVRADGAVAGTVTSAAPVASGGFAAIALLRSEVPPGAIVEVGGGPATVEELD
jgi:folate-binding protein YgfZ